MTEFPESTSADTAERTTWMRRYTLDPSLAEEFIEFLTTRVFPARESLGFTIESMWLDTDKSQLTWFVSRQGNSEEFAAAEKHWEESEVRAEIFAGRPQYVTAKDLREVTRLH
ncbi:hypothetical protein [Nesterenkonia flava]|uniref:NIPSNAP domain-containing protein n=1 Tax=Nesterenkonia flava TaxID=469799 RepID=A0ABU1FQM2_9MICC|nr:hypothetical protein [Nesterenkonia flava]MDR5710952.1 hypothetical protein [Nesterenkonia flava]